MADLLQSVADAVFAAINAPALTTYGPVFSDVPQGTKPPYAEIGAIDAEEIGGKGGGLEQHGVEIEFHARSRRQVVAMMAAARTLLADAPLTGVGAVIEPAEWRASATDRETDGTTWHGISRFEVIAQQG